MHRRTYEGTRRGRQRGRRHLHAPSITRACLSRALDSAAISPKLQPPHISIGYLVSDCAYHLSLSRKRWTKFPGVLRRYNCKLVESCTTYRTSYKRLYRESLEKVCGSPFPGACVSAHAASRAAWRRQWLFILHAASHPVARQCPRHRKKTCLLGVRIH